MAVATVLSIFNVQLIIDNGVTRFLRKDKIIGLKESELRLKYELSCKNFMGNLHQHSRPFIT